MLTTPNFGLKKIELADSPPDITVINFNWDTIDTKLKDALDKATNWDTFRKSGGDLLGGITTESLYRKTSQTTIPESTALEIGIKSSNGSQNINMWLGKLEGLFSLCPSTVMNGALSLGTPGSLRFKDLWLSGSTSAKTGYTKLPNGMILQWGEANFTANSGGSTVTFPLTFPSACYSVVCTNIYANSKAVVISLGGVETTPSSFYAYLQDTVSGTKPTFSCIIKWMAIGA